MSSMVDKVEKDTSSYVKRQTYTSSSKDEDKDTTSKQKRFHHSSNHI